MTDQPAIHFTGGRIFDGRAFHPDTELLVVGERIAAIGGGLEVPPEAERVELGGRWLLPGLVDCHVHFREPGLVRKEGYATGSAGALHGGVTTVLEIQNNPPLMETRALLDRKIEDLRGVSRVDYAPYGSLTDEALADLPAIAARATAVKCFLGCSTGAGGVESEEDMRRLFAAAAAAGVKVVAHCEDNAIMAAATANATPEQAVRHDFRRPAESEIQSIRDAIRVAGEVGAVLHVFHISTAEGGRLVAEAAAAGRPVTGTTAPHYLLADAEMAAAAPQNRFKVNPSIKAAENGAGLRALLERGLLQGVGTDHAPHPLDEKDRPYDKAPSGFPSIDLLLPLLVAVHDRHGLSLERALEMVTRAPAEEFGLDRKGRLEVGADADLVVADPTRHRAVDEAKLPSKSKWSPYHGWELRAFPERVWLRGRLAFADGAPVGEPRGLPLI
jgi:dihydroorotase